MEPGKLMTLLFYEGNFNREGRRMRAVLEKEISDGTQTYRLWRAAGKPDLDYPRADNDKYILHVEVNGYLAPLRLTDYDLTNICGFEPAAQKLYGGKEKRGAWIDALRESGGNDAVSAAVAEERNIIEQYGGDPARQTAYIRSLLDDHVSAYLKSKKTGGGQSFPDFAGALVLNELAKCSELSAVYRAKQQAEAEAHHTFVEAENPVLTAAPDLPVDIDGLLSAPPPQPMRLKDKRRQQTLAVRCKCGDYVLADTEDGYGRLYRVDGITSSLVTQTGGRPHHAPGGQRLH